MTVNPYEGRIPASNINLSIQGWQSRWLRYYNSILMHWKYFLLKEEQIKRFIGCNLFKKPPPPHILIHRLLYSTAQWDFMDLPCNLLPVEEILCSSIKSPGLCNMS